MTTPPSLNNGKLNASLVTITEKPTVDLKKHWNTCQRVCEKIPDTQVLQKALEILQTQGSITISMTPRKDPLTQSSIWQSRFFISLPTLPTVDYRSKSPTPNQGGQSQNIELHSEIPFNKIFSQFLNRQNVEYSTSVMASFGTPGNTVDFRLLPTNPLLLACDKESDAGKESVCLLDF